MRSFGRRRDGCRIVWLFLGSIFQVIYVIFFGLFLNMRSLKLGYRILFERIMRFVMPRSRRSTPLRIARAYVQLDFT